MKQIFQNLKNGEILLEEIPVAVPNDNEVIIQSKKSLMSLGTEKMLLEFGRANIFEKAQKEPERLKEVFNKIKNDGLINTVKVVLDKLEKPIPVGYCNSGIIIDIGKKVKGIKVGDRVVSNGYHSEIVCVSSNLIVKIPDEVDDISASFTPLASVSLQSIRILNPNIGEKVAVIGLGLVGLIACQILKANGCKVIGFEKNNEKIKIAEKFKIQAYNVCDISNSFLNDFDGVIIASSSKDSSPLKIASQILRQKGRIVLVGTSKIELDRKDFYEKEISFAVSKSYGAGRYERNYEEKGLDYPIAYVPWTIKRNFETILELLKNNLLNFKDLVSKIIPFENYKIAYENIDENVLGIVFDYPRNVKLDKTILFHSCERLGNNSFLGQSPCVIPAQAGIQKSLISPSWIPACAGMTRTNAVFRIIAKFCEGGNKGNVNFGFIGAGNYASLVLVPEFSKTKANLISISSKNGISAQRLAKKFSFNESTSDYNQILKNPNINTVVIASPHNLHSNLAVLALNSNKNVFLEKPLGLNYEEVEKVKLAYQNKNLFFMMGFNRRFSPFVKKIKELLKDNENPITMTMLVNVNNLPNDHILKDDEISGGRVIGEICHFIDLMIFIAKSKVKSVFASSFDNTDNFSIVLNFENNSIGNINYFVGNKSYPKERLEIFVGGKNLVLENFKKLSVFGFKNFSSMSSFNQDKGQKEMIKEFVHLIQNGGENLIPFDEILNSAYSSFAIIDSSLKNQLVNLD